MRKKYKGTGKEYMRRGYIKVYFDIASSYIKLWKISILTDLCYLHKK